METGIKKDQEVRSLQSVMNEMAQRIDTLLPEEDRPRLSEEQKFAEIQIYRTIDPLLGELCKEYEDIKEQYKVLLETNGADDPMTEIAADMLESAKSAADTRMIELQQDQKIVAMAIMRHKKMQEEEKQAEEQKRQQRLKKQTAYWHRTQVDRKEKNEEVDLADVMLGAFLLYMTMKWNEAAFKFSLVRRDFVQAV